METETRQFFPLKKILVSTDGSENAERAVQAAIQLAKQNGAELVIVHIIAEMIPAVYSSISVGTPSIDYSHYFEFAENEGKKIVNAAKEKAEKQSVRAKGEIVTTPSSVVESILKLEESEKADLIVIGTRGLGGFKRLVLGSVSSGVVAHAKCAVLVVR